MIGIDGNEANEVRKDISGRVGVNQYSYEILCEFYQLLKNRPKKHRVIVFLKNPPSKDLPQQSSFWQYQIIPGKKLWVITKLLPYLLKNREKINVFFSPNHYLPPLLPVPQVCTIHDLGYLDFSGQFKKYDYWQLRIWTAISIYISKYIIGGV